MENKDFGNIDFDNIDIQNVVKKVASGNIDSREAQLVYTGMFMTIDDMTEDVQVHCKTAIKQLKTAQTEEALEKARQHFNEIKNSLKLMNAGVDLALESHRSLEDDER